VFANGRLEHRDDQAPAGEWRFPEPLGMQPVATQFTMADSVTIPHHIRVPELASYMTMTAVADLVDPSTPPPTAEEEDGRSSQLFVVDVVARYNGEVRRATASGRDIYAVSAPLVVEALGRVLEGSAKRSGVFTAGEIFDAKDFLRSMSPGHLIFG
jgi:hypothetical protein